MQLKCEEPGETSAERNHRLACCTYRLQMMMVSLKRGHSGSQYIQAIHVPISASQHKSTVHSFQHTSFHSLTLD